ncbi:MAG: hypothetical protein MZV70_52130 [Desulfobacterales bacterium]|nr:hypothetical protein [Desulfobacterales bacterium]
MDIDTFKPTFVIQIEGQTLSADITQEITSFVFEDNEEELDVLELAVTDRNLQFVDDPLFQEGNEIVARFGYVGNLSPRKKAVIKDIDYDFPEDGDPTIRIKAYDKGFKLAGKENQKVWQKPAPGILYSEIAEEIAGANGLTPVVTPTKARHLRVTQSNVSDAQFLKELAGKARDKDGDGVTGYVFYIQDDELHFHPRDLDKKPAAILEYFTDRKGVLRSFRPSTQSQGAKGAGVETKAVGVDPRKKEPVEHKANNETTPERTSLGKRTYLVDGNTGEGAYKEQESGQVVATFERSEGFHEEPRQEPAQDSLRGEVPRGRTPPGGSRRGDHRHPRAARQAKRGGQGRGPQVLRRLLLPFGPPRHRRRRISLRTETQEERPGQRGRRQVGRGQGQAERPGSAAHAEGRSRRRW